MKQLMLQVCLAIKILSKIRKQETHSKYCQKLIKSLPSIWRIFTPHDKALDNILFEGIKSCLKKKKSLIDFLGNYYFKWAKLKILFEV